MSELRTSISASGPRVSDEIHKIIMFNDYDHPTGLMALGALNVEIICYADG